MCMYLHKTFFKCFDFFSFACLSFIFLLLHVIVGIFVAVVKKHVNSIVNK